VDVLPQDRNTQKQKAHKSGKDGQKFEQERRNQFLDSELHFDKQGYVYQEM
jgi:hypothetical protein